MTLNNKQSKKLIDKKKNFIYLFIAPIFFISIQSIAEESYKLSEMEINRTINSDNENNLDLPSNPFEIVDRLRRANSMNDATKPSVAIDDAIRSFDMINEDKKM